MKKLMVLLLALMLLSCTAFAQERADYAGYWILTSVVQDETIIDSTMLGLSVYMELYEDGVCVLVSMGEREEGTWALTDAGVATTDARGEVEEYTLMDGTLVVEEEGKKLTFTREVFNWPLANLTMADFNGTWELAHVHLGADVYGVEEMGLAVTLTLADDKGHLIVIDAESTVEYDVACVLEEIENMGTVIHFRTGDAELQQNVPGLMLMLYGNGELVWNGYDWNGTHTYSICFVRVEGQ